jgi:hypothetical protein
MTISEKIIHSTPRELHLYKEGVFWTAYEQSAYMVSQIKTLKATKKHIKSLSRDVVSVGFPESSLPGILPSFTEKGKTDTHVILESAAPVDTDAFESWRSQIPLREAVALPVASAAEISLPDKIKAFKLHQATPMECMIFIAELQNQHL